MNPRWDLYQTLVVYASSGGIHVAAFFKKTCNHRAIIDPMYLGNGGQGAKRASLTSTRVRVGRSKTWDSLESNWLVPRCFGAGVSWSGWNTEAAAQQRYAPGGHPSNGFVQASDVKVDPYCFVTFPLYAALGDMVMTKARWPYGAIGRRERLTVD
ncbi:hypothetical protein K493DRAFT_303429 [Basidiobolus meristosporus CBS 931.73]|uniref:Uncharacterized protein n=1 Tax=Basidiobolus meristosporus CBS 931.73 TaxID=1314790 RepID=A0A1Y1Y2R1_9FUNG|nr:hypothetical protein K493DRAFT_303429 [Basidiobolus meristosporus CBS 931.73]|eukprot:ORX92297.1 hypothetical protein K493DRAFT_303429 [Basidiobolus meristosporus CBS 931.73]